MMDIITFTNLNEGIICYKEILLSCKNKIVLEDLDDEIDVKELSIIENTKLVYDMKNKKISVIHPIENTRNNISCLCEYILDNKGKPILDFDCDISIYIDTIEKIIYNFYNSLYNINISLPLAWKYSNFNGDLHFHCIVDDIFIEENWSTHCIFLVSHVKYMLEYLVQRDKYPIKINIDECIYKNNTSLRMIYQYKYDINTLSYIRKLLPYGKEKDFKKYLITDDKCNNKIRESFVIHNINRKDNNIVINKDINLNKIPKNMKIYSFIDNTIQLHRICKSYCPKCNREHKCCPAYIFLFYKNYIVSEQTTEYRYYCYKSPYINGKREYILL